MATTIAITNQKGGVGKSTLTYNLGPIFGAAGCRTLIVDADPQGNLSSGILGPACVEQLEESETIAGLFSECSVPARKIIRETAFSNLSLVPANELLSHYSMPVEMAGSRVATLRDMVREVEPLFDVILFDNAPALNSISWSTLLASDYVIIPTIPEDYSSQGLAQVCRTVAAAQQRNARLQILGLVLTLVQPRLTIHRAYEIALREQYGETVFETIIKAEKLHKEAITKRQPLCVYKPRSAAAKTYAELAEEIGARIEGYQMLKEVA